MTAEHLASVPAGDTRAVEVGDGDCGQGSVLMTDAQNTKSSH